MDVHRVEAAHGGDYENFSEATVARLVELNILRHDDTFDLTDGQPLKISYYVRADQ